MTQLTHLNKKGEARMVDISTKALTHRQAIARSFITMSQTALDLIVSGKHKKGDVLATARIAGIMAAKQTAHLIPMCHPLLLSSIVVDLNIDLKNSGIEIITTCQLTGQTGVEMEALVSASITALTLYDMCKAVDKNMVITQTQLMSKSGGKSGEFKHEIIKT